VKTVWRLSTLPVLAAVWGLGCVPAARALEKVSVRLPADALDEWSARGTILTISYFNLCSGWTWAWSGFEPGERVGVNFRTVPSTDVEPYLVFSRQYVVTGAPSGYGFTGVLSVHQADASGCPVDPPLASYPWLPAFGDNLYNWIMQVPWGYPGWVLLYTSGPGENNPVAFLSDRPAGAPGPAADCGLCYPVSRQVRSFRYGTSAAPLCPGVPFVDTECAAELVWVADGYFLPWTNPALPAQESVESRSWGGVKSLYR
jgi:hypothetical protein